MAHEIPAEMLERVARVLYLDSHAGDEYAVGHWDFGGAQHVNREPWLTKARQILAAALPERVVREEWCAYVNPLSPWRAHRDTALADLAFRRKRGLTYPGVLVRRHVITTGPMPDA